jgi:hypothetical protein
VWGGVRLRAGGSGLAGCEHERNCQILVDLPAQLLDHVHVGLGERAECPLIFRRPSYVARRQAGQAVGDLSEYFMDCSTCAGRGKVCVESADGGARVASLEVCGRCGGDGFLERVSG